MGFKRLHHNCRLVVAGVTVAQSTNITRNPLSLQDQFLPQHSSGASNHLSRARSHRNPIYRSPFL